MAEQRVGECVVVEGVADAHDARLERAVDRIQRVILFEAGDLGGDRKRERHIEQCRDGKQPVGRVGQA